MTITYGDLPNLIGLPSHIRRPALYCCCGQYSANRGDYFMQPDDAEIVCSDCGEPMELLVERVTLEPWSPAV